jgi:hypothetical protein
VSMSYFSCPPTPKINIHLYFHEYYSVETFKASYATPIPALTGQSHRHEVETEFSLCPPLIERKACKPR